MRGTSQLIFVTLLFTCWFYQPVRAEAFKITAKMDHDANPAPFFYWLAEDSLSLTIQDIVAPYNQNRFKKYHNDNINFGFSKKAVWLKLTVHNFIDLSDFIIEINNPDLNYVSFYEINNNEISESIITGELYKFSTRRTKHRNFVFPVQIRKNQLKTFYFRSTTSRYGGKPSMSL